MKFVQVNSASHVQESIPAVTMGLCCAQDKNQFVNNGHWR